jgi:hypothetical protein
MKQPATPRAFDHGLPIVDVDSADAASWPTRLFRRLENLDFRSRLGREVKSLFAALNLVAMHEGSGAPR